jgi:HEPN domain-containing protein
MFKAIAFPHSHDLVRLLDLCLPDVCEIDVFRLKLARLSQFAVDARYPSESYEISREQAADALELAQKIVVLIEERLPESASDLP